MGSISDKPLIFITGATGHIGFRVLAQLLEAGYRARVASRKLASAQRLKGLPSIKPYADSVEFIEIPDFLADDAFESAVRGATFIFHLASPLPDADVVNKKFDLDEVYLKPAVQGTVNMLQAASTSTSIKRVVITSSVAILGPVVEGKPLGPDDIAPVPSREAMAGNPFIAYPGSKILAYNASEEFMAKSMPSFDLVHVLPAYVQGRHEAATGLDQLSGKTSNGNMVRFVLGQKSQQPDPSDFVFVDDVAAVHIAALNPQKAKAGERFIAASPKASGSYDAVVPIVKKLFPEAVKNGLLPLGGGANPMQKGFDSSKSEEKLGVKFQGLEVMVGSLIGQVVELKEKEVTGGK